MPHNQEGVCTSGVRGRVFALQGISKSYFSSDRGVFGCFRAGAWIHIAFVQGFVLTHLWRICITVFVLVRRFCYTEHGGVSCSQVLFAKFFLVLKQVFLSFKPSRSVCLLYSGYVFIVLWNFSNPFPNTLPFTGHGTTTWMWHPATQSCAGYFCAHNTEHYYSKINNYNFIDLWRQDPDHDNFRFLCCKKG